MEKLHSGVLSQEEFESIKTTYEKNRPEFARTEGEVRLQIENLDKQIEAKLRELKNPNQSDAEDLQLAISVLLQGRNFLALYLGEEQRQVDFQEFDKPTPAIQKKVVAVVVNAGEPMERSVQQVLELTSIGHFKVFSKMNELIEAVVNGAICGVVAVTMPGERSPDLESWIRHDLKNLEGIEFEDPNSYLLPPCASFSSLQMIEVMLTVTAMSQGAYQDPKSDTDFDLKRDLPALSAHMQIESCGQVRVCIVDDSKVMVQGMIDVLQGWPRTGVHFIHVTKEMSESDVATQVRSWGCDMLLLDEGLKHISGSDVLRCLETSPSERRPKLVASISAEKKPSYVDFHFQKKGKVATEREVAVEFINFMNRLRNMLKT